MIPVFALVAAGLAGSGQSDSYAVNVNQRGLAKAAGVTFEIFKPGNGTASIRQSSKSSEGPPTPQSQHQIQLGNVEIILKTNQLRIVTLSINGRIFGAVEKGDHVVIDEAREVTINGQVRKPVE